MNIKKYAFEAILVGMVGFGMSYFAIWLSDKRVKENPCPTVQHIDPQILQLAYKRGALAGQLISNIAMTDDKRSFRELERDFWQTDSVIIQNCIKLNYGH